MPLPIASPRRRAYGGVVVEIPVVNPPFHAELPSPEDEQQVSPARALPPVEAFELVWDGGPTSVIRPGHPRFAGYHAARLSRRPLRPDAIDAAAAMDHCT
ncbi:MAG: hypothetical protein JO023_12305 [Chloroflexi bacterium]|nr:hypothetical protein [Chloroflexota bacterium]